MDEWKGVMYSVDPKLSSEFENVLDEEAESYARSIEKSPIEVHQYLTERDKSFLCRVINVSTEVYPPRKRKRSLTSQGFLQMIQTESSNLT